MNFEDNKGLFVEEARELLEAIEAKLLELEDRPGDEAIVDDVFRSLHTIKGSGAMFGFDEMTAFAHGLENLFDEVRKGRLGVTRDIIGLTLESVDCLSSLLEGRDDDAARARGSIESRLEAVRRGAGANAADTSGSAGKSKGIVPIDDDDDPAGDEAFEAGLVNVYRVRFKPDADILGRGVKIENLFAELAELGDVAAVADASRVPELDALEPSSLYLSWIVTVSTTRSPADVSSVFMFVEDYAELRIERLRVVDAEGKPAVPPIGEILAARGALARDSIA
ncbi:MAG: Hpt domain-containing protein [Spirochaetaceae bacterium]|nr:Hpt domain-containing protein [Spirochaetaceae bacterium]